MCVYVAKTDSDNKGGSILYSEYGFEYLVIGGGGYVDVSYGLLIPASVSSHSICSQTSEIIWTA